MDEKIYSDHQVTGDVLGVMLNHDGQFPNQQSQMKKGGNKPRLIQLYLLFFR